MTTKPKPRPLTHAFILTGESKSEFSHLHLTLLVTRYERQMRELFTLTWQSNREARHDFYGLRLVVNHSAFDGPLLATATAIAALLRKLDPAHTPAEILARLAKLRIPRVAHESRLHAYITEAEQLPPGHARWMDDYETMGTGSCTRAEVAASAEEARALMAARWAADAVGYGPSSKEKFTLWMEKGCPMKRDRMADNHPAMFTPLTTLLHTAAAPLPLAA